MSTDQEATSAQTKAMRRSATLSVEFFESSNLKKSSMCLEDFYMLSDGFHFKINISKPLLEHLYYRIPLLGILPVTGCLLQNKFQKNCRIWTKFVTLKGIKNNNKTLQFDLGVNQSS